MARVGLNVRRVQALAMLSYPTSQPLAGRQPPAPHNLSLGISHLLADQATCLWINQPGRAGNHPQHTPHLLQDSGEHPVKVECRDESMAGLIEQLQLLIALAQDL